MLRCAHYSQLSTTLNNIVETKLLVTMLFDIVDNVEHCQRPARTILFNPILDSINDFLPCILHPFATLFIVCKHTTDLEAKTYTKTLKSYDRPSQYIQLVDCTWKIVAKDDHVIRFTVSQLDMGGCTSCGFLQIFDGQTEWIGTNLGKWRSGNPDLISSGKYMTVKFKTTKFDTNNGLIARYYAIPKTSSKYS